MISLFLFDKFVHLESAIIILLSVLSGALLDFLFSKAFFYLERAKYFRMKRKKERDDN